MVRFYIETMKIIFWEEMMVLRRPGDIGPDFNGIIGRLKDLLQY